MTNKDIKAVFWNIGKKLTDKKLDLLKEAITSYSPEIFCIAEGSNSKKDCQKLVDTFKNKNYKTFYSPLFPTPPNLKLSYVSKRLGLKIFIKDSIVIKNPFAYEDQRRNGRIVMLRVFLNYKLITFIFLHNKSKKGETHETLAQTTNIKAIYEMINVGKAVKDKERIIILGDFNLNPWDRLLDDKEYLKTSYFQNRNLILKRGKEKYFYNPLVDLLSLSKTVNLGGTYYSNNSEWGLFDFVLYDTSDMEIQFDILTELKGGSKLLNPSNKLKKSFINYDLDHLPIAITINKLISAYEQYK